MNHEEIKTLLAAYLEGELDDKDKTTVEAHLETCSQCREECTELQRLEEVLGTMEFKKPPDDIWDVYWSSIYNKLERKIGWILFSIGLMITLFMGAYPLVEDFITDPGRSPALKLGILAFLAGTVIVFVSILREQLFFRRKERYKDVRR